MRKKVRLEFKEEGPSLIASDLDSTEPFFGYDYRLHREIRETRPKKVGRINIGGGFPCCGTRELHQFWFAPGLTVKKKREIAKFLVKHSMKHLKKGKHYSLLSAFFLKAGKEKSFRDSQIMTAMLDAGWKKLGKPFYNRRYGTKVPHLLQGLIYIIQSKKKGNFYE